MRIIYMFIAATLTPEELAQARKNLQKSQKKKKKTRTELYMENINKGVFPSNPLDLTEEQIDQVLYFFSSNKSLFFLLLIWEN